MYGGTTGINSTNTAVEMSKVFILSLPSFHWIEAPQPADTWRSSHACEAIGPATLGKHNKRQMISIGGTQDPSPNGVSPTKVQDAWTSGMKILDLTALTWADDYDANAKAYERPDVVNTYYDENTGYPKVWGDPAVEAIFKTDRSLKVTAPASPTTTGSNADPTSPGAGGSGTTGSPDSTTTEKKSTNTGAIAGGVVGGVAGLALVGLAAFFWRRRTAQKDQKYSTAPDNPALAGQGPTELPVTYTDQPKAELPVQEYYRSELP